MGVCKVFGQVDGPTRFGGHIDHQHRLDGCAPVWDSQLAELCQAQQSGGHMHSGRLTTWLQGLQKGCQQLGR